MHTYTNTHTHLATRAAVWIPPGVWVSWDNTVVNAQSTLRTDTYTLAQIPLWVPQWTILPLKVSRLCRSACGGLCVCVCVGRVYAVCVFVCVLVFILFFFFE